MTFRVLVIAQSQSGCRWSDCWDDISRENPEWLVTKMNASELTDENLTLLGSHHDAVLALGKVAGKRLDALKTPHLQLPHPSGLNRLTNDQELISAELRKARSYLLQIYAEKVSHEGFKNSVFVLGGHKSGPGRGGR